MARPRARFSPLSRQRPLRSGRFSLMVRRPTAGGRVVTGVAPGLQNRWQALRSAVGSTPMRPRQKAYFRTSPKNFGSRRLERKNLLRSQLQEFFMESHARTGLKGVPLSCGTRCDIQNNTSKKKRREQPCTATAGAGSELVVCLYENSCTTRTMRPFFCFWNRSHMKCVNCSAIF